MNESSTYLAHKAPDGRTQSVKEHLEGTAELAGHFASAFGAQEQGYLAGLAHDIGKCSIAFQKRLLEDGPKVDHSTAGAYECMRQGNQIFAALCIAGHHSGLPDGGSRVDPSSGNTFLARLNRANKHEIPQYNLDGKLLHLPIPAIPPYLRTDQKTIMFFTRMLYSCLVDADYLDTEAFMTGQPRDTHPADFVHLEAKLQSYIAPWFPPKTSLNELRCSILQNCKDQGQTEKPGFFTLTVPTGGGKTVASLAFALAHARANHLSRIIYVIPYTSIIEQTAQVFRDILGEEYVLEHHSGVLFDTSESATAQEYAMAQATENWDMPVIVTTAVQFFESLYSNRSSKCRKLHNLANSVLIFDEAQMMPLPCLRPCVYAIAQLVEHYHASAVLCTATQPVLGPIFREFCPTYTSIELCPKALQEATLFRRVTFRRAGRLSSAQLAQQLQGLHQVLCVVNTRKQAQEIYSLLPREGSFHLSTLMYPAHRQQVLSTIRQRLHDGLPCRVVSTSLIEAGVDVDFPQVYREQAGLDSMLQAAGRCNREGKRPVAESIVTIFQGESAPPAQFSAAIAAGNLVLEQQSDLCSQTAISAYFTEWMDLKGKDAQDASGILSLMEDLRSPLPFRTVAERFHLIEQQTKTIYIPLGEGTELVHQLVQGYSSQILFRKLGRYGVSVYDRHYQALMNLGLLDVVNDDCAILRDTSHYNPETGLSMDLPSGVAHIL